MARQIQIRRGTATEHENFTGAIGEITMDTTNKTIRIHDGETMGGTALAKQCEIPDSEKIISATRPNYSAKISVTNVVNESFTCPSDGYIMIQLYGSNSAAKLYYKSSLNSVGDESWAYGACNAANNGTCIYEYRVRHGEVLTCISSAGHSRICEFVPLVEI